MSRDVITVGSTMRIPLLYRGEYSQWRERFMNYLEEQTDGEAMINSIQNGDHSLPVVAQVSLTGTAPNAPPTLKDPKFWTAEEKKNRKIDHLARSLLIQRLPNDIYSLIDSNDTAKDLWDALERQMRGSEYGEQDRKAAILYEYETFKATEGEQLLDTYLRYLQVINDLKKCGYKKDNCELNYKFLNNLQPEWKQYGTLMRQTKNLMDINIDALYNILKQNQGDVNEAMGHKKKAVVVTSDPLALVAEKTKVNKRKEKVAVQSESEGSDDEDISDLKKITALLAKAFNRKKYYAKPTNNNLRTSSASYSANKKPEYVKSEEKKEDKKVDEKKRDMSKVKCYNCKKEGHFAKDCKKAKVKDYNYYKTKMLLAKKDSDEQWGNYFFDHIINFAIGCNSSFVALIPKVLDPKVVSDYRPISLIGSLYKVVTKILASRLSLVISDLISDVQTAFLPNRQILDGPFIINEILARCKLKKQQAMIFKVDFAKAYDSVRWDYLDDVLISFGFGPKWRSWIRGSLSSGKASILVNGSPTTEFHLYRGLKQGDPLAPFLFLLIMESLHLSFSRAVEAGIFKGYKIDPSTTLSHLFYADDAVFIGEWSHSNLKGIMNILRCFSLLSGMSINIQKSHLLGVGIPDNCVAEAAKSIGCLIMKAPFKYLGILVGDNMSSKKAWDETINKMKKRLSRWKLNTLSVGGRLTLLKSVLGSTPIYNMSIFKVPKSVLNYMESLRRNFFNGFQEGDRKIAWVKWSKVLASKKFGGLGVSSFFALNRALLFKWVWRYLSHDNSLWSRIISALHGLNGHVLSAAFNSTWSSIITEVNSLKVKGVDLISHCKIRVGKGTGTSFWKDLWIGDNLLKLSFPRLFALEENKDISVADKMNTSISSSFRRHVRGGVESQQLDQLSLLLDTVILSNMDDRWFWDLNGDGVFQVKDVRSMLDEAFLPKMEVPTRWIKSIPIKVNVFAWKLYLDRLPTRSNLSRRNVSLPSLACPLCDHVLEDSSHLFFGCSVAKDIQKLICRWWNLDVHPYESYEDWLSWFKSIRLGSKTKEVLEGVFYVSWWSLWNFRNQFLFASPIP
ncbi:RNA-directed DNA polymerase, eukaryota [Tanacetum coccineum]